MNGIRNSQSFSGLAVGLLLALLNACGGGGGGTSSADVGASDGPPDQSAPADLPGPADTAQPQDRAVGADQNDTIWVLDVPPDETGPALPCGGACPEEFCEVATGRCLDCLSPGDCTYPSWCRAGQCVVTACYPGAVWCEGADRLTCGADGETIDLETCPAGQACANGTCLDVVCEPRERGCESLLVRTCNDSGTGYQYFPCPPGSGCYGETCSAYKHNVVLIFDTSGSMGATGGLDAIPCICGQGNCPTQPYPACELADCPISKLGLSKWAFNQLFATTQAASVNFAMTRFPQRIKQRGAEDCGAMMGAGWYEPPEMTDGIEGDDGSHVTGPDSYFDRNLWQILSVPFPKTLDDDPLAGAVRWMDFDEQMQADGTFCLGSDDCPGGACTFSGGRQQCHYHSNPELRSTGNTPLGRSLFYAGEYIRKYVVVDGKPCTVDADCGNVNYVCTPEGVCNDPFRACRATVIMLFTDGVEEPATDESNFFNPRVQAKRMRYGLGCASDGDCLEGATCDSGTCQGYPTPNGGGGTVTHSDGQGANRLLAFDGQPIQVTTHVIDMSGGEGAGANARIADEGGGLHFDVYVDEPQAFLDTLVSLFDIKAYLGECIPEVPGQ